MVAWWWLLIIGALTYGAGRQEGLRETKEKLEDKDIDTRDLDLD